MKENHAVVSFDSGSITVGTITVIFIHTIKTRHYCEYTASLPLVSFYIPQAIAANIAPQVLQVVSIVSLIHAQGSYRVLDHEPVKSNGMACHSAD